MRRVTMQNHPDFGRKHPHTYPKRSLAALKKCNHRGLLPIRDQSGRSGSEKLALGSNA